MQFTLHQSLWERAEKELKSLKIAANKSSYTFEFSYTEEPDTAPISGITPIAHYQLVRHYRIETNLPTAADRYELLGTLDHMSTETQVVLNPLPGRLIPPHFVNDDGGCDHCNTRRRRRTTYVLVSATGEVIRVGSTCLHDFIGLAGARIFQWQVKIQQLSNHPADSLPEQTRLFQTTDVLALAIAVIRQRGFVPVSQDEQLVPSTKALVQHLLGDPITEQQDIPGLHEIQLQPGAPGFTGDHERAQAIQAWAATINPTSHYLHQLKSALQHEIMPPQALAIVVSSIAHTQQLEERRVADSLPKRLNQPLGSPEDTIETNATLLRVVTSSKKGFVVHVCTFREAQGHTLKWFSETYPEFDIGTQLTMHFSVQRHDEYKGSLSTVVDHCILSVA